jgi:hypothetical protein
MVSRKKLINSLLAAGLMAPLIVGGGAGCARMFSAQTHKLCEDELAEVKGQQLQTVLLAQKEREELDLQRQEIQGLKSRSSDFTRSQQQQIEQEIADSQKQIEQERQALEKERFQVNQMRDLNQSEVER